jgi:hypothetical protein
MVICIYKVLNKTPSLGDMKMFKFVVSSYEMFLFAVLALAKTESLV